MQSLKINYQIKKKLTISHLEVKNFTCEICGKKFGKKFILNKHILTHSKDKSPKEKEVNESEEDLKEESYITQWWFFGD